MVKYNVWIFVLYRINGRTTQKFYRKLAMLSAFRFEEQKLNAITSINLSPCKLWLLTRNLIHWQQCIVENLQVLVNISQGKVIDWNPYDSTQELYSNWELLYHWSNSNKIMEFVSPFIRNFWVAWTWNIKPCVTIW